jgi:Tfp pilus assembly protein PilF
MRTKIFSFALLSLALATTACSSTSEDAKNAAGKGGLKDDKGNVVNEKAAGLYQQGLSEMEKHDKAGTWNEANCAAVAKVFLDSADEQDKFFAPAIYNAGVAYHRCGNVAEARKYYTQVLEKDAKHHRARVQLARLDLAASNDTAVDKAMAEFERAVADSEFQNVEALVEIARLQVKRNNNAADKEGANDFERAKKNLQRALAVDDAYMPAFNQLAIYYLERAKQNVGKKRTTFARGADKQKVDSQALDLALLVASQAVRKNPGYAPIHNTAGLVSVEAGDLNRAVQSFGTARKADPSFFEAHMNYAAVNMMFRGFGQAEEAYRAAIKLKPTDYDAHLGLALALRGQIDSAPDGTKKMAEAEQLIEKAKTLDAARPEAFFNHAILTQEYKAKGGKDANAALEASIKLFEEFAKKAQGKAEFADAVEDVTAVPTKADKDCLGAKAKNDKGCKRGRIFDIKEIIEFNKQSAAEQKKMEEEAKNRAAIEEAAAGAEEEKK